MAIYLRGWPQKSVQLLFESDQLVKVLRTGRLELQYQLEFHRKRPVLTVYAARVCAGFVPLTRLQVFERIRP